MASKVVMCLSQYTGKPPYWNSLEMEQGLLKFCIGDFFAIIM
ncbi:hypothetical protein T01_7310, partial [Trichinella spiralis]